MFWKSTVLAVVLTVLTNTPGFAIWYVTSPSSGQTYVPSTSV